MATPTENAAGQPVLGNISDADLAFEAYAKLRIGKNPGLNIGPILLGRVCSRQKKQRCLQVRFAFDLVLMGVVMHQFVSYATTHNLRDRLFVRVIVVSDIGRSIPAFRAQQEHVLNTDLVLYCFNVSKRIRHLLHLVSSRTEFRGVQPVPKTGSYVLAFSSQTRVRADSQEWPHMVSSVWQ